MMLLVFLQLSRQHARNMEALASLRDIKKSGGKGDEEIFMNFGDIFVAGTREKVEEQLKVSGGGGRRSICIAVYLQDDIRHTSLVTRHTSHVTRHTSHVTRHTSHVTRHSVSKLHSRPKSRP
jgi:hypothetical protein